MNTNLGIVLLCAPLALAAERGMPDLPAALASVLAGLDRADAQRHFRRLSARRRAALAMLRDTMSTSLRLSACGRPWRKPPRATGLLYNIFQILKIFL